ncbi:hypothetical protein [Paracoccus pacificus]|uniref:Peptidoglycan binding domain-containing protein n=1 Tax=Paracoccus pacificus TaxID=1463598 RepID=A0ABW4R322_9RHOB
MAGKIRTWMLVGVMGAWVPAGHLSAQEAAPGGTYIRIEAKRGQAQADASAADWKARFPDVVTYPLPQGWVGIALGPLDPATAQARLDQLRAAGSIPADSFLAGAGTDSRVRNPQPVAGETTAPPGGDAAGDTPAPNTPAASGTDATPAPATPEAPLSPAPTPATPGAGSPAPSSIPDTAAGAGPTATADAQPATPAPQGDTAAVVPPPLPTLEPLVTGTPATAGTEPTPSTPATEPAAPSAAEPSAGSSGATPATNAPDIPEGSATAGTEAGPTPPVTEPAAPSTAEPSAGSSGATLPTNAPDMPEGSATAGTEPGPTPPVTEPGASPAATEPSAGAPDTTPPTSAAATPTVNAPATGQPASGTTAGAAPTSAVPALPTLEPLTSENAAASLAPEAPAEMPETLLLQRALRWSGSYTGPLDGDAGPGTRKAIEAELKAEGRDKADQNAAMRDLVDRWQAWRKEMQLTPTTDADAGLSFDLPAGLVSRRGADGPMVIYEPRDGSGTALILLSQTGGADDLRRLAGLIHAYGFVAGDGPRDINRSNFTLDGANDRQTSHAEARLTGQVIQGFVLISPADQADRHRKLWQEIAASLERVAPPRAPTAEAAAIGAPSPDAANTAPAATPAPAAPVPAAPAPAATTPAPPQ